MQQLTIEQAIARADDGMERALAHAEQECDRWGELAWRFIQLYALKHKGERFTGRQIVLASKTYGLIQPPTDKAFGGPIQRAVRAGIIRKVGFAPDPNRHCSPVPLFEAPL